MTILVTGGSGFIGSAFILDWLALSSERLINLDVLSYAANPLSLADIGTEANYRFLHADINDREALASVMREERPRAVINFAAESHVDRSIHDARPFLHSNIAGTLALLDVSRSFWDEADTALKKAFRFLQVSTDEVYGTLEPGDDPFTENHAFTPNSPYAASKAAADMLVRSMYHTHRMPVLTTHCSNNYGPRQYPEKLIPLTILNALNGRKLPIYGDGTNVRDWLHVSDHCAAIRRVLEAGLTGERYNVGGKYELRNIDLVKLICATMETIRPRDDGTSYQSLITFVKDRPGHDRRYAIDNTRMERELGWTPAILPRQGLKSTIQWYLDNEDWVVQAQAGEYTDWIGQQYQQEGVS